MLIYYIRDPQKGLFAIFNIGSFSFNNEENLQSQHTIWGPSKKRLFAISGIEDFLQHWMLCRSTSSSYVGIHGCCIQTTGTISMAPSVCMDVVTVVPDNADIIHDIVQTSCTICRGLRTCCASIPWSAHRPLPITSDETSVEVLNLTRCTPLRVCSLWLSALNQDGLDALVSKWLTSRTW